MTPSTLFCSLNIGQGELAELERSAKELAEHVDKVPSSPVRDIPDAVGTAKEILDAG